MTRPTILDRDDVAVVPLEPTPEMASRGADAFFSPSPESVAQENARAESVFCRALAASPHFSAWQEVREYVAGLEKKEARASASLTGLLDALEHHTGERHGIMAIRHLVDRIAELEKRLADAKSHRVLADPCVKKLEDGEPFFVLLGRDADASQALSDWVSRRLRSEGRTEKVKAAENTLDAFRDFQDFRAARAWKEGK